MTALLTLINLTIKEYYRRKIFIVILLMLLVVAGTGLLANPFTIGVQSRLMRDLSLLFIQAFCVFFALSLGATAIPNDVERKFIYPFVAHAITRGKFLWGKFLAISLVVGFSDFLLGIELIAILHFSTNGWHWAITEACLLLWIECMVVTACAIWFSTFMTAPVAFAAMILVYVVGSLSHVYASTLTTGNTIMHWFLPHLKSLLPYFDYFSIRSAIVHDYKIRFVYFADVILYGILYVFLAMLLSSASFSWKDL